MHPLVHRYTKGARTGHSKVSYSVLKINRNSKKARGYGLSRFIGILSSPTFLYVYKRRRQYSNTFSI